MMERVSLKGLPKDTKISILEELGFESDGIFVYDECGKKIKDRYLDKEISLDNMLIFPGSCVILDNNPLSIAAYFEEYGEIV